MKKWQHGYELDYLIEIADKFSEHNEYACSPFSEIKKNIVASCLKDGTIVETENSIIITKIVNSKRSITADGFTTIAVKEKGDRIVEAISGDYRELVKLLSVIDGSTWLLIFEENEKHRNIAIDAGYKKIGSKISSFAEIIGVYFKDGGYFGDRKHLIIPEYEKYALRKLKIDWEYSYMIHQALDKIKNKLESLPEFTNHYSNYNAKGSWSALSLRGYRPEPAFITKPIEMNKKWKEENPGCLEWKIEDTPMRKDFPEIETLMDLLPGDKHRIRLMKLKSGGGELRRHTDLVDPDQGLSDGRLARIHFPVVTNKDVIFNNWDWDGNAPDVNMQVGEAWYLDVRKPHRAINGGTDERIHIVVDVVSSQELRNIL